MATPRVAGLTLVLVLCAVHGCDAADAPRHPRTALFHLDRDDPVQRHLATPARLSVVYWPAMDGCGACEIGVARTLSEVESRYAGDTRVVTVVPPGLGSRFAETFRVAWPGTVVELDRARYDVQRELGPLPRVEVWSANGDLLLLRSLPANLASGRILEDEILWCRSFTAPLEAKEG